jgi:hypothetical protein
VPPSARKKALAVCPSTNSKYNLFASMSTKYTHGVCRPTLRQRTIHLASCMVRCLTSFRSSSGSLTHTRFEAAAYMRVHMYTCIYVCNYVCIRLCINVRVRRCACICMRMVCLHARNMCIHACMHCVSPCMYACVHARVCHFACMHVCMPTFVSLCTYACVHVHVCLALHVCST